METPLEQAQRNRDNLIDELLNETAVYIAGGDPVGGHPAGEQGPGRGQGRASTGSIPQFHEADSPDWHKVIERAKKGDGDALEAVGHKGDPETHPVCAAILAFVGSGKKGTEIRKQFAGPPYGWPQDAIDAALIVLHRRGHAPGPQRAARPSPRGSSTRRTSPTTEFRVENVTLTKVATDRDPRRCSRRSG